MEIALMVVGAMLPCGGVECRLLLAVRSDLLFAL